MPTLKKNLSSKFGIFILSGMKWLKLWLGNRYIYFQHFHFVFINQRTATLENKLNSIILWLTSCATLSINFGNWNCRLCSISRMKCWVVLSPANREFLFFIYYFFPDRLTHGATVFTLKKWSSSPGIDWRTKNEITRNNLRTRASFFERTQLEFQHLPS